MRPETIDPECRPDRAGRPVLGFPSRAKNQQIAATLAGDSAVGRILVISGCGHAKEVT